MRTRRFTRALLASAIFALTSAHANDTTVNSTNEAGPVETSAFNGGLGASGTLTVNSSGNVIGTGAIGIVVNPAATSTQSHTVTIENNSNSAVTEVRSTTLSAISIAPTGGTNANSSTSTININSGATVQGGTYGISFIDVEGEGNTVTITNNGSVLGGTEHSIHISNDATTAPNDANFTITNNGTISASAAAKHAINIAEVDPTAFANSNILITNSGTITSENSNAIVFGFTADASSLGGVITNNENAIISGHTAGGSGSGISFLNDTTIAQIVNSGTITGGDTGEGIYIDNGGLLNVLSNTATGTIGGSTTARGIQLVGGANLQGGLANTGTIQGSESGITLSGAGTVITGALSNTGTIIGGTDAAISAAVNDVDITGGITNSSTGTITAGSSNIAINLSGSTGNTTVTNNGTITGEVKMGNGNGTTNLLTLGANSSISRSLSTETAISGTAGQVNAVTISGTNATVTGVIDLGTGNNAVNVQQDFSTGGVIKNANVSITASRTLTANHTIGNSAINDILTFGDNSNLVLNSGVNVELGGAGTALTLPAARANITFAIDKGVDTTTPANNTNSKINASNGGVTVNAGPNVVVNVTGNGFIGNNALFTLISSAEVNKFNGNADGTVTGAPSGLTFTLQAGGTQSRDLEIKVTRRTLDQIVDGASVTIANNISKNVGSAIETNNINGNSDYQKLVGKLFTLSSTIEMDELLRRLAPDVSGDVTFNSYNVQVAMNKTALARLAKFRDGIADMTGAGYSAGDLDNGVATWIQFYGHFADQENRNGIIGFESDTYGTTFGVDWLMGEPWRLGVALGAATTNADSNHDSNKHRTDIDHYSAMLYTNFDATEQWYIDGLVGYSYNRYRTKRRIVGGGLNLTANGKFDGNQYVGRIGTGYKIRNANWLLTPNASFEYAHLNVDTYTERDAPGANLYIDSKHADNAVLAGDIRLAYDYETERGKVVPTVHAGISYDFVSDEHRTTSSFINGGTAEFISLGAEPAKFGAQFGASFAMHIDNAWEITATYDVTSRSDFKALSGLLSFRYTW